MNEGIVLKRTEYQETSVIINLIASDGFHSLIIKGAKRKNSAKLALCEPITKISFITSKPSSIPSLIEGEVIDEYRELKEDITKLTLASVVSEYAFQLRESLIDINDMYDLVDLTLQEMKQKEDPEMPLFRFEIILARLLGIGLRKEHLRENYQVKDTLVSAIQNILDRKTLIDKKEFRYFIADYFEKELDLKLKSKKMYFSIME